MNNELKELLDNWDRVWECRDENVPWNKCSGGSFNYGDKVAICWKSYDNQFEDDCDYGYITCVPGYQGDPEMESIVHVPDPWGDKQAGYPIWVYLVDLLLNPEVKEIRKI